MMKSRITYKEETGDVTTIAFPDGLTLKVASKNVTRTIRSWLKINNYQYITYGYRSRLGGKKAPLVIKIN